MSKIDELINQLCPDGVEHIRIGDVVDFEQPSKYIVKSTDYSDEFEMPVLTAGQTFILGYTSETDNTYGASKENPVIIFDDFTGAFKWVDFEFKVKSSAMKMLTVNNDRTTLRYIYHIMGNIGFSSDEHKRLWIGIYSDFLIPLPPLEVQSEIVRILDNFTELTAELTAELTVELASREKQYEHYRDRLLTFDESHPMSHLINQLCPNGVEYMKLGDIIRRVGGSNNGIKKNQIKDIGTYPVYTQSANDYPDGFVDSAETLIKDLPVILYGDHTNVIKWISEPFIIGADGVKLVKADNIDNRFLYHVLLSKIHEIPNGYARHFAKLRELDIPIPPLEVQSEIVRILDNFSELASDISSGLPAEIEARQKQYEYYRDKLLSFDELKAA